jgi:hypothetical protein
MAAVQSLIFHGEYRLKKFIQDSGERSHQQSPVVLPGRHEPAYFREIVGGHLPGHNDAGAPIRLPDEPAEHGRPVQGRGLTPGGQHPLDAEAGNRFEGFGEIGGFVDCFVESDLQRTGEFHQRAGPHGIYPSHGIEQSEYHACRSELPAEIHILPHHFEFGIAVTKISAPGPDHHHNGYVQQAQGGSDGAVGRRGAAHLEIIAQLDPAGAQASCLKRLGNVIDWNFLDGHTGRDDLV